MKRAAALLVTPVFVLTAGLSVAQDAAPAPMTGMDHSTGTMGTDAPSAAPDTMTSARAGMESTGDADADFLLMMIPHHQSAVDMSQALLPQVKDPEVKALAEAVIATQEAEIASMEAMLARLGHPVE